MSTAWGSSGSRGASGERPPATSSSWSSTRTWTSAPDHHERLRSWAGVTSGPGQPAREVVGELAQRRLGGGRGDVVAQQVVGREVAEQTCGAGRRRPAAPGSADGCGRPRPRGCAAWWCGRTTGRRAPPGGARRRGRGRSPAGRRRRAAGSRRRRRAVRTSASPTRAGSRPRRGAGEPGQAAATRSTRSASPVAAVAGSGSPSSRGSAVSSWWPVPVRPRPGRSRGTRRAAAAVDLGVERVAEPQLDPGAEQVAGRGAQVAPAPGCHHEVDAEREAARRDALEHGLEVVVVGAQVGPAVDHDEHLAVPVARPRPPAAAAGRPSRRRRRGRATTTSRRSSSAGDVRHHPAYDVGLAAGRDGGHVGEPRRAAPGRRRRGRPRRTWASRGVWVSARAATRVCSSVVRPLRGAPTTARCPPAPPRSTTSGSRRCSRGRSTVPSGSRSGSARRVGGHQAEPGLDGQRPEQVAEGVGAVERRQPDRPRRGCRGRPGPATTWSSSERVAPSARAARRWTAAAARPA